MAGSIGYEGGEAVTRNPPPRMSTKQIEKLIERLRRSRARARGDAARRQRVPAQADLAQGAARPPAVDPDQAAHDGADRQVLRPRAAPADRAERCAPRGLRRYAAYAVVSASSQRMTSGSRSIASNRARAGASGVLRCCSQSRKVVIGR